MDVYVLLNVRSVVVRHHGFEVTYIVELEEAEPHEVTAAKLAALGFEVGPYP